MPRRTKSKVKETEHTVLPILGHVAAIEDAPPSLLFEQPSAKTYEWRVEGDDPGNTRLYGTFDRKAKHGKISIYTPNNNDKQPDYLSFSRLKDGDQSKFLNFASKHGHLLSSPIVLGLKSAEEGAPKKFPDDTVSSWKVAIAAMVRAINLHSAIRERSAYQLQRYICLPSTCFVTGSCHKSRRELK